MEILKLTDIMEDWFPENFPSYSFTVDYMPYVDDGKILGVGKVFRMDGVSICRVTDVEVIPWINHDSVPKFHAADPEFFEKIKSWISNDIVFALWKKSMEMRDIENR